MCLNEVPGYPAENYHESSGYLPLFFVLEYRQVSTHFLRLLRNWSDFYAKNHKWYSSHADWCEDYALNPTTFWRQWHLCEVRSIQATLSRSDLRTRQPKLPYATYKSPMCMCSVLKDIFVGYVATLHLIKCYTQDFLLQSYSVGRIDSHPFLPPLSYRPHSSHWNIRDPLHRILLSG